MKKKWYDYLWISCIFLCYVFSHALEYISGICRKSGFKTDSDIALDI